jgi:hypothetical protein
MSDLSPPPQRDKDPRARHVVVLLIGGIFLALGGCAGSLASLRFFYSVWWTLLLVTSLVGVLILSIGVALFIVNWAHSAPKGSRD